MEWSTDRSCPTGSKVGDVLKVEMEQMLDGVEILSVVKGREKNERGQRARDPADAANRSRK